MFPCFPVNMFEISSFTLVVNFKTRFASGSMIYAVYVKGTGSHVDINRKKNTDQTCCCMRFLQFNFTSQVLRERRAMHCLTRRRHLR